MYSFLVVDLDRTKLFSVLDFETFVCACALLQVVTVLSHPQDGVSQHPTVRYVFVEVFIMPALYNPNTAAEPSLVVF